MSSLRITIAILTLAVLVTNSLQAQHNGHHSGAVTGDIQGICDACAEHSEAADAWLVPPAPNWGYGYADLLVDLARWQSSPFISIDSIGRSVNGRALWKLTITAPQQETSGRRTVFIHARTHPNEVQTTYVVNQIVEQLLSENDYMRRLREEVVFHIVPMYNPDGVELEYGRQNANRVDLERDWEFENQQPESAALKREFVRLMASGAPIEVALNLHSALACRRYFVYHHSNGTSPLFAEQQQQFIEGVRRYFPTGMQRWNYSVTWDTGTPALFPESWWWRNQKERVMALTYEDMNCESAGLFDSTAWAILHGVGDWLGVETALGVDEQNVVQAPAAFRAFPNPFTSSTQIQYRLDSREQVSLHIADALGRKIMQLVDEDQDPGLHTIRLDADQLPPGIYFAHLRSGAITRTLTLSYLQGR